MAYVCAELAANACAVWTEAAFFPPMSLADGAALGTAIGLVYATAWGFNILCRSILNKWG